MASVRKELFTSSSDESDYEPQAKKKRASTSRSTPTARTSTSAARDVENIAPNPELIRLENRLKAFSKDIFKAFPWTKFGSDRDAFCYRRVRGHLGAFKRECLEDCKNFIDSKQWTQAIDYIIMAWTYVDKLPRWDDSNHNKINEQTYKKLSTYLVTSLKKGTFQKKELEKYIDRFKQLTDDDKKDNGMQKSIEVAETVLKKVK